MELWIIKLLNKKKISKLIEKLKKIKKMKY